MTDDPVVCEIDIRAPAGEVYEMFTDPAKLVRWIGIRALLEPRPGGEFRFELMPGEFCSGRYLELVPGRRVVFTWGWESGALPVAPGSSTVEVDFEQRDAITVRGVLGDPHGVRRAVRATPEATELKARPRTRTGTVRITSSGLYQLS